MNLFTNKIPLVSLRIDIITSILIVDVYHSFDFEPLG